MTLREKLIVSRNKAGLSQMELAERLGVSRQAVSRWESGDTTPTMDKLKALAKLYGVSLDWLFGDTADGEPPEAAKPEADRPPDEAPRERKVRKSKNQGHRDRTGDRRDCLCLRMVCSGKQKS